MSGTTTEHAADEAAGEEIFTSEGREPPIVTSPPPLKQPETTSEDDKALLETTGLSAEEAFEVFAGKIYPIQSSSSGTTTAGLVGFHRNRFWESNLSSVFWFWIPETIGWQQDMMT